MKINSGLLAQTLNGAAWCSVPAYLMEQNIVIPADMDDAVVLCVIYFFLRFYFSVYTVFTKHPPASWGSSSSYPIANSEVPPCSHSPPKKHSLLSPLRSQCWLCHKCSPPSKPSCFPIPCSISITALTLLVTLISNPNITCLRPHANSSSLSTSAWAVVFFLSTAKVHNPAPNTFCHDCSLSGLFNTKFPYLLFKQGTANKNNVPTHWLDIVLAFPYLSTHYYVKFKVAVMVLNVPESSALSPVNSGLCWKNWKPQIDTSLYCLPDKHPCTT